MAFACQALMTPELLEMHPERLAVQQEPTAGWLGVL